MKDKVLPDQQINPSPLKPEKFTVVPSNTKVSIKTWIGSDIPSSYAFAGEMGTPAVPHFYRPRDAHLAVLVNSSFLIDKYAVTCAQFSTFLNELTSAGRIQNTKHNGEYKALADGRLLVVDALDRWKENDTRQPWMHAAPPFGITYQSGLWTPILNSELLPITLVSWWGARLYSLWAHGEDDTHHPQNYACLPTPEQWYRAATWDVATHAQRSYPWGDHWEPQWVNFSGYWAGKNIIEKNWQNLWAKNPIIHSKTRPLPVADLTKNTSPAGCVQMLGNTWEWTLSGFESRLPIRGGCAFSPMEHCQPTYDAKWAIDMPNEYIGFRCSYSLRRF